jgi:hypothetical protein
VEIDLSVVVVVVMVVVAAGAVAGMMQGSCLQPEG